MTPNRIPNLHIIVAACVVAVSGYALFSIYAVVWLRDATMTGDIIGTWKSFAVAAFAFWLGSSQGGKSKDEPTGTHENPTITKDSEPATGTKANPTIVEGAGEHAEPVPTTEGKKG